jgi:hypothetical protein
MKHADIIIPFTNENETAVSMLAQNLQIKLKVMKQQKKDVLAGRNVRSFSDILSTPDHKPKPSVQSEVSGHAKVLETLADKEVVTVIEEYAAKQAIKGLARKLCKILP